MHIFIFFNITSCSVFHVFASYNQKSRKQKNNSMKKTTLITLILFVCLISTFAQERRNSIFLEGGGTAVWYSLNYERQFSINPMNRIALGTGISLIPLRFSDTNFVGLLSAGYLYGYKHNLETGVSAGYNFLQPEFIGSLRIGYRYEASGGFQFRIGFSPIYGKFVETGLPEYDGKMFLPWGYLSVGYTF